MPEITPSAGPTGAAGPTFNGGTITAALAVDAPSTAAGTLHIHDTIPGVSGSRVLLITDAQNSELLGIDYTAAGQPVMHLGPNGIEGEVQMWADYDNDNQMNFEATAGGKVAIAKSGGTLGFYGHSATAQAGTIADASAGVVVDAEARTALNALLAAVRALGLIAT